MSTTIRSTIRGPFEIAPLAGLSALQRCWVIVFGSKMKCEQLTRIKYGYYYGGTFYVVRNLAHPDPIGVFGDGATIGTSGEIVISPELESPSS